MNSENAVAAKENGSSDDAISVPLYIVGLAVSILGILAVNSSLSDTQFGTTTIALTVLGFMFSIGCRWMQINPRVVEVFMGCICLFFCYRFLTHSIDPQFFVPPEVSQPDLVIAVVLAWLTVVRSWILTNDDSVIFTAVTSVAMIGLVGASNLNAELLVYFFGFVVCATFLLLHQTYLTQRSFSVDEAAGRSESGVITLQAVLSLVTGIAVILIATLLVVPLRAIGTHLSLANALKNFVSAQHLGGNSSSGTNVALSDDPNFRVGTGSGYSASDQIVMHVHPGDLQRRYYRGRTYDLYVGNGWSSSSQGNSYSINPQVDLNTRPPASTYTLYGPSLPGGDASEIVTQQNQTHSGTRIRFTLVDAYANDLYLPYGTKAIQIHDDSYLALAQSSDNSVTLNPGVPGGFSYWTYSIDPVPSNRLLLRSAPSAAANCPGWIRQEYIDQRGGDVVSVSDQERLETTARDIVDELPPHERTDYDIAEAIRNWVSHQCLYSLDVSAVPTGDDAVSYFLFDARKGYCDLFASSMAILCRYAGLPARVATGFDSGEVNDRGGFDLKVRDKHAWVEVWFKGYGWQLFDPTLGSVQDTATPGMSFNAGWIREVLARIRLFIEITGALPIIITLGIALALFYVVKVELLDKRYRIGRRLSGGQRFASLDAARKKSAEAAAEYSKNSARYRYHQFETIVMLAGIKRQDNETPNEFLAIVLDTFLMTLEDPIKPSEAARRLTEDVMMASYAPIELVGETLVDLEQQGAGNSALSVIQQNAGALRKGLKSAKYVAARR